MIQYSRWQLDNGLQVLFHPDKTTPLAMVNVLYRVGSRNESPEYTGLAHLFEHLMFGGSRNVTDYDKELEGVGGDNNAFTSPDITDYYATLPAANLETALWLESDRMMELAFRQDSLDIQKKVVIEEFKQRYYNQPYGEAMLELRPLAYKKHPYRWPTIGKEIGHIEKVTLDDIKAFFYRNYRPDNAVLVVSGHLEEENVKQLVEKWFGDIPAGHAAPQEIPAEPEQREPRHKTIERDVPLNAVYKAWHMGDRLAPDYYATDLASDVLGRGKSSRLYQRLVKDNLVFNSINAHITGSMDPGLLLVQGKLNEGVSPEEGDRAVEQEVEKLVAEGIGEEELFKVKNNAEATQVFGEQELMNRTVELAVAAAFGDPELVNQETEQIRATTTADVHQAAQKILRPGNCSTLYYKKKEES